MIYMYHQFPDALVWYAYKACFNPLEGVSPCGCFTTFGKIFMWHFIFTDVNNKHIYMVLFVLEIRRHFASARCHVISKTNCNADLPIWKSHLRIYNLAKISFWELTECIGTPPRIGICYIKVSSYLRMPFAINYHCRLLSLSKWING